MLVLILYCILLGVTIWGIFSTSLAGWIFFGLVTAFASSMLLVSYSLTSKWIAGLDKNAFTDDELTIFRRYTLYFMLPFQAQQFSRAFSFVQILCLIWLGLSAWRGNWVLLGVMIVLLLVATQMVSFLNQGNFLRYHYQRGKLSADLVERLEIVESVEGKIRAARGLT